MCDNKDNFEGYIEEAEVGETAATAMGLGTRRAAGRGGRRKRLREYHLQQDEESGETTTCTIVASTLSYVCVWYNSLNCTM